MPGHRTAAAWLCGLAALAAGCGSSSPAPSPQRAHSNLQSIFESEGLLHTDPALAFKTFKALGADRVRFFLNWNAIAPNPTSAIKPAFDAADPNAYPATGWTLYDTVDRASAAAHVPLDLTVGAPPPLWAAGRGAPAHSHYAAEWRTSARDFGAFMHALGVRYSGRFTPPGSSTPLPRISFWSIWNEPNYGVYLAPQTTDDSKVEIAPTLYRRLVDAAWNGLIGTGHTMATDRILIGETAPRGLSGPGYPGRFSGMVPLRFIRALYCVDTRFRPLRGTAARERGCPATAAASARFRTEHPALFQSSGWADHPYPDALPPTVRTPPPTGDGYADFAALDDLEHTLDRSASAYGSDPRLPIWSTEFGYPTNPPRSTGLAGVPLPDAARYLNESEYLSWRNPRVRSYDQYLLTDPPPGSGSNFVTGLEFYDGAPKPDVYDAYRMPLYLPDTSGAGRHPLEVWGCVRPADYVSRTRHTRQRVAVQFAAGGSPSFRTIATVTLTDPHDYFDVKVRFPGSGTVRLLWTGSGHPLRSRYQPIQGR